MEAGFSQIQSQLLSTINIKIINNTTCCYEISCHKIKVSRFNITDQYYQELCDLEELKSDNDQTIFKVLNGLPHTKISTLNN